MNIQQLVNTKAADQLPLIEKAKDFSTLESLIFFARLNTFDLLSVGLFRYKQKSAGVDPMITEKILEDRKDFCVRSLSEFFSAIDGYIPEIFKGTKDYATLRESYLHNAIDPSVFFNLHEPE